MLRRINNEAQLNDRNSTKNISINQRKFKIEYSAKDELSLEVSKHLEREVEI